MHSQAAAAASDRSATSASRHADYDGILSVADESCSVESQRLRSAVDTDTIAAPAGHDYATESPPPSEPSESSCLLPKATAMKHNSTNFREQFRNRSALVDLLVIFFGIGAWIGVNSNFVQLPLLVVHAPEGWNLPSYMVIVTQLGNIGPLLYTVLQRWKSFPDSYMIYAVLIVGTLGSICMAFLYETTAFVFGAERSVAMLVCVFALALVGCTSSVLFMPYMGRFRDIYLITYIIGEGLSGFLPSIVALIQGVGGNAQCIAINGTDPDNPQFVSYTPPPRFGSMEYFIFVFVVLIFSTVAFVVLDKYPRCRAEYASVVIKNGNDYTYETNQPSASASSPSSTEVKIISNRNYVYLMILLGLLCMFGNGIFPSVQSYSCLPYGNIAYHLTVTLSTMANPVACFMAVFLPHTSIRAITTISLLAAAFTAYALATAFLSPAPPLVGKAIGDALVIITWTIVVGLVSYVRLSITTVFRYQGGKSLVWAGGVTQIGSLIGSVLSFGLINFTDLFQPYYPC
ncbi:solute carrier family 52, riboflavin transporter, member 3-B [Toxorhynchites rutilus septentrionalis]|uniref:solute carrier family 52, riboflavin transporter, member 3-B n=1 Tax=Toxorhynchites rutilus septentrionalis TaxID=329112 RepID=UPI00247AF80C|nr:solute carrier family 52, riboflavin transporter, member 3-B [Toxorhynchites rutilus septentrionalis]XP_055617483.1 solute carrier family 52, riboflavin transporter, member 3-B [Toxorhynchites rutilus septentrionalis]XP_055617484.1 solute carrier family 52, riboflavin transporter, member 3-B [Toxorhynchites rutilus septentrionalis]